MSRVLETSKSGSIPPQTKAQWNDRYNLGIQFTFESTERDRFEGYQHLCLGTWSTDIETCVSKAQPYVKSSISLQQMKLKQC